MPRAVVDLVDRHAPRPLTGKASDVAYFPLVPLGEYPHFAYGRVRHDARRRALLHDSRGRRGGRAGAAALATISFVNLKTARAARRAVEVGVRKVCGAGRGDLMVQFIGESLIYAALAMIIATALVELLLLPWLNAFLDRSIVFDYWRPRFSGPSRASR